MDLEQRIKVIRQENENRRVEKAKRAAMEEQQQAKIAELTQQLKDLGLDAETAGETIKKNLVEIESKLTKCEEALGITCKTSSTELEV